MTRIVLLFLGMFCTAVGGCQFDEDSDVPDQSHGSDVPPINTKAVPEQSPNDDAPPDNGEKAVNVMNADGFSEQAPRNDAPHVEQNSQRLVVKASELFDHVEIIGELGVPLGQVVTIRGQWNYPNYVAKHAGPILRVLEVEGRPVTQKLELGPLKISRYPGMGGLSKLKSGGLWSWQRGSGLNECPRPLDGDIWELRGVEMGWMHRYLPEASGGRVGATAYPDGFVTRFEYFQATCIEQKP